MEQLIIDDCVISTPLIDIVKDIRNILDGDKLRDIKLIKDNIRVTCPSHKEGKESKAASDIYIGESKNKLPYGYFNCFVCGEQGPFYHFVAECFNQDDEWAKEWLIDNYADGILTEAIDIPEIKLNEKSGNKYLDESVLETFTNFHPYMLGRKLNPEIIKKFEIKYDPRTKCIVFPIRNLNGKLVGLTRRNVANKNFFIDENFDKSNIYCLDKVVGKYRTCVIVESQLNALTCWEYGMPALALYGAGTTDDQLNVLNRSEINNFILMYDNDSAGKKGSSRFKRLIRRDKLVVDIKMPYGKDVNDLNEIEFYNLLKNNGIPLNHIVNN